MYLKEDVIVFIFKAKIDQMLVLYNLQVLKIQESVKFSF